VIGLGAGRGGAGRDAICASDFGFRSKSGAGKLRECGNSSAMVVLHPATHTIAVRHGGTLLAMRLLMLLSASPILYGTLR